jgi:HemY protein
MLVRKALSVGSFTRLYFFSKSERKAREDLSQGLTAFLLQDWARAEQLIAGAGEHSGLSDPRYLLAAAAANEVGENERVQAHLSQVEANNKEVVLFKANLLLAQDELELALGLVQPLYDKKPKDEALLGLYVRLLERLGQWDKLLALLSQIEKSQMYAQPLYTRFSSKVVTCALRDTIVSKTIDAVELQWKKLPKKLKKRNDILGSYIGILAVNGKSELAEDLLLKALKKEPVADFISVFRQVTFAQPMALNQYLQSGLKNDQHNTDLLYALGHLAARSKDYELASKALSKAVKHEPTKADLLVLGDAYGKIGEPSKAIEIYQQFVD